jgi:lysozyme family protein
MEELPYATAKQIARDVYWNKFQCDAFDIHIAYQLFDAAYNGGHPVQWLQQALGVTVDGVLGQATILAASKAAPRTVAAKMNSYRLTYMTNLPDWKTFGAGWSRRIAKCLLIGVSDD